ncbi:MAG: DUF11 domain-containing protein, partial [Desulfobacterales bacterium]|nr:DUF11 domain-containing protein [Desulfobacterales bacterium]
MASGSNATMTLTAEVDAGTAGTSITNTATVTAVTETDTNAGNDSDDATLTVLAVDLGVTKVVDDATPNEGDVVTYTVTLLNNGPDTATGMELTDALPSGVTYSNAVVSQGSYASSNGLWTVGSLASGSNATMTLTAEVDAGTAGTSITNTATVTAVTET